MNEIVNKMKAFLKAKKDKVAMIGAGALMAVAPLTPHLPGMPNSFSIDLTGLLGYAEDIFNGLMPAFLPIIGISLGISLLLLIVGTISVAVAKRR